MGALPRRPRAPPAPSALVPELPEVLSALVLKLLAKMAEDRYQTARGPPDSASLGLLGDLLTAPRRATSS